MLGAAGKAEFFAQDKTRNSPPLIAELEKILK